jgi:hypothetical protein
VRRQFPTRYTAEDAALLARVDAAHEELSGPAVKRILRREREIFGYRECTRLAEFSVSSLLPGPESIGVEPTPQGGTIDFRDQT